MQKDTIAISCSQLFVMQASNGINPRRGNDFQPGKHFILLQKSILELYLALLSISLHLWNGCRASLDQLGSVSSPFNIAMSSQIAF